MKYYLIFIISFGFLFSGCTNQRIQSEVTDTLVANENAEGLSFDVAFLKGKHHNHPSFVFWIEDLDGNFIETLFVTKYVGTGVFGYQYDGQGKWENKSGPTKQPATLPYWLHKRGVEADGETFLPTPEAPVADAITGATPKNDFKLAVNAENDLPQKFKILMEINQPWDWNEYWNNGLYPNDQYYKTSCQPALVYAVTIDQSKLDVQYYLNPIGHSHYSGKDGELYTDISSFTTAAEIVNKVIVRIKN